MSGLSLIFVIRNHNHILAHNNANEDGIHVYYQFKRVNLVHQYRDRIYIRKDILLKLYSYGELNQSALMSYCGLNNVKHKEILNDMVKKGMLTRTEEPWGNKSIIKYKASEKGREIQREILEPYEEFFPRREHADNKSGQNIGHNYNR
jgi:predicted transcriptional regulator